MRAWGGDAGMGVFTVHQLCAKPDSGGCCDQVILAETPSTQRQLRQTGGECVRVQNKTAGEIPTSNFTSPCLDAPGQLLQNNNASHKMVF